MHIIRKSSSGTSLIPLEDELFSHRKLYIEGSIDHDLACNFAKQLEALVSENRDAPINVYITSPGGSINAGMMIYDLIQSSPAPLRMICRGEAYSMAAVLFASGRHGRYMLPNSELMLHEPLLGSSISGNSSSIRSISDSLLESKRKMSRLLSRHTGRSEEEVNAALSFDHYFSPEESIEFGLCDKIINNFDIITEVN